VVSRSNNVSPKKKDPSNLPHFICLSITNCAICSLNETRCQPVRGKFLFQQDNTPGVVTSSAFLVHNPVTNERVLVFLCFKTDTAEVSVAWLVEQPLWAPWPARMRFMFRAPVCDRQETTRRPSPSGHSTTQHVQQLPHLANQLAVCWHFIQCRINHTAAQSSTW